MRSTRARASARPEVAAASAPDLQAGPTTHGSSAVALAAQPSDSTTPCQFNVGGGDWAMNDEDTTMTTFNFDDPSAFAVAAAPVNITRGVPRLAAASALLRASWALMRQRQLFGHTVLVPLSSVAASVKDALSLSSASAAAAPLRATTRRRPAVLHVSIDPVGVDIISRTDPSASALPPPLEQFDCKSLARYGRGALNRVLPWEASDSIMRMKGGASSTAEAAPAAAAAAAAAATTSSPPPLFSPPSYWPSNTALRLRAPTDVLNTVASTLPPVSEDGNEEACAICGQGGDIVCCDSCASSFHAGCEHDMRVHGVPPDAVLCMSCKARSTVYTEVTAAVDEVCLRPAALSTALLLLARYAPGSSSSTGSSCSALPPLSLTTATMATKAARGDASSSRSSSSSTDIATGVTDLTSRWTRLAVSRVLWTVVSVLSQSGTRLCAPLLFASEIPKHLLLDVAKVADPATTAAAEEPAAPAAAAAKCEGGISAATTSAASTPTVAASSSYSSSDAAAAPSPDGISAIILAAIAGAYCPVMSSVEFDDSSAAEPLQAAEPQPLMLPLHTTAPLGTDTGTSASICASEGLQESVATATLPAGLSNSGSSSGSSSSSSSSSSCDSLVPVSLAPISSIASVSSSTPMSSIASCIAAVLSLHGDLLHVCARVASTAIPPPDGRIGAGARDLFAAIDAATQAAVFASVCHILAELHPAAAACDWEASTASSSASVSSSAACDSTGSSSSSGSSASAVPASAVSSASPVRSLSRAPAGAGVMTETATGAPAAAAAATASATSPPPHPPTTAPAPPLTAAPLTAAPLSAAPLQLGSASLHFILCVEPVLLHVASVLEKASTDAWATMDAAAAIAAAVSAAAANAAAASATAAASAPTSADTITAISSSLVLPPAGSTPASSRKHTVASASASKRARAGETGASSLASQASVLTLERCAVQRADSSCGGSGSSKRAKGHASAGAVAVAGGAVAHGNAESRPISHAKKRSAATTAAANASSPAPSAAAAAESGSFPLPLLPSLDYYDSETEGQHDAVQQMGEEQETQATAAAAAALGDVGAPASSSIGHDAAEYIPRVIPNASGWTVSPAAVLPLGPFGPFEARLGKGWKPPPLLHHEDAAAVDARSAATAASITTSASSSDSGSKVTTAHPLPPTRLRVWLSCSSADIVAPSQHVIVSTYGSGSALGWAELIRASTADVAAATALAATAASKKEKKKKSRAHSNSSCGDDAIGDSAQNTHHDLDSFDENDQREGSSELEGRPPSKLKLRLSYAVAEQQQQPQQRDSGDDAAGEAAQLQLDTHGMEGAASSPISKKRRYSVVAAAADASMGSSGSGDGTAVSVLPADSTATSSSSGAGSSGGGARRAKAMPLSSGGVYIPRVLREGRASTAAAAAAASATVAAAAEAIPQSAYVSLLHTSSGTGAGGGFDASRTVSDRVAMLIHAHPPSSSHSGAAAAASSSDGGMDLHETRHQSSSASAAAAVVGTATDSSTTTAVGSAASGVNSESNIGDNTSSEPLASTAAATVDADSSRSRLITCPNEYDWLLAALLRDGCGVSTEAARDIAARAQQAATAATAASAAASAAVGVEAATTGASTTVSATSLAAATGAGTSTGSDFGNSADWGITISSNGGGSGSFCSDNGGGALLDDAILSLLFPGGTAMTIGPQMVPGVGVASLIPDAAGVLRVAPLPPLHASMSQSREETDEAQQRETTVAPAVTLNNEGGGTASTKYSNAATSSSSPATAAGSHSTATSAAAAAAAAATQLIATSIVGVDSPGSISSSSSSDGGNSVAAAVAAAPPALQVSTASSLLGLSEAAHLRVLAGAYSQGSSGGITLVDGKAAIAPAPPPSLPPPSAATVVATAAAASASAALAEANAAAAAAAATAAVAGGPDGTLAAVSAASAAAARAASASSHAQHMLTVALAKDGVAADAAAAAASAARLSSLLQPSVSRVLASLRPYLTDAPGGAPVAIFAGDPSRCDGCRYGWNHVCAYAGEATEILEDGTVMPPYLLVQQQRSAAVAGGASSSSLSSTLAASVALPQTQPPSLHPALELLVLALGLHGDEIDREIVRAMSVATAAPSASSPQPGPAAASGIASPSNTTAAASADGPTAAPLPSALLRTLSALPKPSPDLASALAAMEGVHVRAALLRLLAQSDHAVLRQLASTTASASASSSAVVASASAASYSDSSSSALGSPEERTSSVLARLLLLSVLPPRCSALIASAAAPPAAAAIIPTAAATAALSPSAAAAAAASSPALGSEYVESLSRALRASWSADGLLSLGLFTDSLSATSTLTALALRDEGLARAIAESSMLRRPSSSLTPSSPASSSAAAFAEGSSRSPAGSSLRAKARRTPRALGSVRTTRARTKRLATP